MSSPASAQAKQSFGIPDDATNLIRDALASASQEERLAVCLYYQRDLPLELQTLDRIEQDLRRIFPPDRRTGRTPDDYVDFQASAVRFVFNRETASGRTPRLFENPRRGHWRNTSAGNGLAEAILARAGLLPSPEPSSTTATVRPGADGTAQHEGPVELRLELDEFLLRASDLIQRIRDADGTVVLTQGGVAVAEVLPVYGEPPAELLGSALWQADDAFEPRPELWKALD
jgi:antitoxin (DNA-binding transcriptional repressor) of toxin-antitoxin stability system